jgi:hypothetical protein
MVASCGEAALILVLLLGDGKAKPAEYQLTVGTAYSIIDNTLRPLHKETTALAADWS